MFSILFQLRLAIQPRSDQFRYLMSFVKADLAPQRTELFRFATRESGQTLFARMQISAPSWNPRVYI
jgi:hypothetical protein